MDEKECSICKRVKAIDHFPICGTRNGKVRYRSDCKECYNEKARRGRPRKVICQVNENERVCTRCNTIKDNDQFRNVGPDNSNGKIYKNGVCLECMKDKEIRSKYGISIEEYNRILDRQGNVCAICKKSKSGPRALSIDHNHITGEVRGILCFNCNSALGKFGADDGIQTLLSAIEYIKNF